MNDPEYNILMVVARLEKNWKQISFLYYTKVVVLSKKTLFQHIYIKVPELLASDPDHELIQTAFSLDADDQRGFTLVVLVCHRNISE